MSFSARRAEIHPDLFDTAFEGRSVPDENPARSGQLSRVPVSNSSAFWSASPNRPTKATRPSRSITAAFGIPRIPNALKVAPKLSVPFAAGLCYRISFCNGIPGSVTESPFFTSKIFDLIPSCL
ncbi:hypothetical protein FTUN_6345 [Frigoriglobus tundricola]|uniref:Uncharacterized protein n=1 Tax=Frigoriglobus tundricola TaxID=2774151 RepID=A0A6M5YZ77_9BACT|nr:hypothetical protein FTUN_6345 [Frigoriglobus tundricola]